MIWLLPALAADVPPVSDVLPNDEEELGKPDRSRPPDVSAPVPLALDDLQRAVLKDGLDLLHVQVPRVRRFNLEIVWWKGQVDHGAVSRSELDVLAEVWTTATERYSTKELSELLDVEDIELYAVVRDHLVSIGVEADVDKLDVAIDLLEEVVFHPTLPNKEITLDKANTERFYTVTGPASPDRVRSALTGYAWNSADHAYGVRPDLEAYARVKRKGVARAHAAVLESGPASLWFVGDRSRAVVEEAIGDRFLALGRPGERSPVLDAPMPERTRVLAVDMPKSEQVAIAMRAPAPSRLDARAAGMRAVSYALGGHFLARLNKNLREEKGWTYGVGAWYRAGEKRGSFNVSVDVAAENLAEAVGEIEAELDRIVEGSVTEDEIDAWWRSLVSDHNSTRGTLDDAYGRYAALLLWDEAMDYQLERIEQADRMTVERAGAVAADVLAAPRQWAFVGPREAIEAELQALGWNAEWIPAERAIIGDFPGGPGAGAAAE